MTDQDDDPKKVRPLRPRKKGTNALEAAEGGAWLGRKDPDRDQHRHV